VESRPQTGVQKGRDSGWRRDSSSGGNRQSGSSGQPARVHEHDARLGKSGKLSWSAGAQHNCYHHCRKIVCQVSTLICSRVMAAVWRGFVAKPIRELCQGGMADFAKPCNTRTYVSFSRNGAMLSREKKMLCHALLVSSNSSVEMQTAGKMAKMHFCYG